MRPLCQTHKKSLRGTVTKNFSIIFRFQLAEDKVLPLNISTPFPFFLTIIISERDRQTDRQTSNSLCAYILNSCSPCLIHLNTRILSMHHNTWLDLIILKKGIARIFVDISPNISSEITTKNKQHTI